MKLWIPLVLVVGVVAWLWLSGSFTRGSYPTDPRWEQPVVENADGSWVNPFSYAGGDGSSPEDAVTVLEVANPVYFMRAAHLWMLERFPDTDAGFARMAELDGRHFVVMRVQPSEGKELEFFFDDTELLRGRR